MRVASAAAIAVSTCLLSAWLPPAAHAAVVNLSDNSLTIRDNDGTPNLLTVRPSGFGAYEVVDEDSDLTATGSCESASARLVVCTGFALEVDVDAGGGDDVVALFDDFRVPVHIGGGEGDDSLTAGPGDDKLDGGNGVDSLSGGRGDDTAVGNGGDDLLIGGVGADQLLGGEGDDIMEGSAGNRDTLLGDMGRDILWGGSGNDRLESGGDDDAVIGGPGRDTVGTGTGTDDVFGADGTRDTVDCRAGDRVQGESREIPEECAVLPSAAPKPKVWPPLTDAAALAASLHRPQFRPIGDVISKRKARAWRLKVKSTPAGSSYALDVRIGVRSPTKRLHKFCRKRAWTNKPPITGNFRRGRSRRRD
jgi:RTX calcium-binding nonapeptide repeat (4 copies)